MEISFHLKGRLIKQTRKYLLFSFLIAASLKCTTSKVSTNSFENVQYVKNYDGDTITFKILKVHPLLGDNISIRVKGIDTPEIKGRNDCEKKMAIVAKNKTKYFLENGNNIDLINTERGKYFRLVADVMVNGESLAEYLLKNNLAYSYHGGSKKSIDWCKKLD